MPSSSTAERLLLGHKRSGNAAVALAVAITVVGVALLCRARYVGYDDAWAALWGEQLASGQLPDYDAPFAPTPHPLANLISSLASSLGIPAGETLLGSTIVAFCAAVLLLLAAGWRLYGPVAGIAAGALLLTRPSLVREAEYGSTDLWFLALLCGVAYLSTQRPMRPMLIVALLGVAGLIRPEAWVLSGAFLVWQFWGEPLSAWLPALALAALAPALWVITDAIVTGDPLHSLHGTTSLAAQLDRPRSVSVAVVSLPHYLRSLVGDVPTALGLAGAMAAVLFLHERSLLVLGAAALGLLMFIFLGLFGLPLLARYLLVPAIALTLLAGVAIGGWQALDHSAPGRTAWLALGVAASIAAMVGLAGDFGTVAESNGQVRRRAEVQEDLLSVLRNSRVAAAAQQGGVRVPDYRAIPLVSSVLGLSPSLVRVGSSDVLPAAVVLSYATPEAREAFGVPSQSPSAASAPRPGMARVARNRSWLAEVDLAQNGP